ncbi:hypothetical protein D3C81_1803320 [compost metagenome]
MRDFTVHQQRHAEFFHPFQNRHDGINRGHAVSRVGGGVSRVEFGGGENTFVEPALQFVGIQRVRQIAGH